MSRIELNNLSFRYPGAGADTLGHLNLIVNNGEAHALLGASGAGKTTLLNIFSGLLQPTGGDLLFDGQSVAGLPGRQRNVAQVFQFPVLYESMTVAQNMAFALRAGRTMESKSAGKSDGKSYITDRVGFIAAELGVSDLLKKKPKALSLFEKQLVAVGKALVREDVALVLLDEPLTAVEPRIKWRLRQTLRRAQEDLGVTMVYVTHDQTEALTFADRVSVLTEEGILQTGTPREIYQSPQHKFVGHFVGSPGMNFVPADLFAVSGDTLGFRPEWAVFDDAGQITGEVSRVQIQGTLAGDSSGIAGLTTVATQGGEINVMGSITHREGETVTVKVNRYVLFNKDQQVGAGEFA